MNQEVPTGDIIFGAIGLIIFLILAYVVGRSVGAWKNKRFTKAWAPLVPLINGTITNDGAGTDTSWLTGTYRGKQVRASMTPGISRHIMGGESGPRHNEFDVALVGVPGDQDWRIVYQTAVFGTSGWQITTDDQALKDRLQTSDITAILNRLGARTVRYSAYEHTLRYSDDVTPRWAPTPERFQEELEVLLLLATIQEEMNKA